MNAKLWVVKDGHRDRPRDMIGFFLNAFRQQSDLSIRRHAIVSGYATWRYQRSSYPTGSIGLGWLSVDSRKSSLPTRKDNRTMDVAQSNR